MENSKREQLIDEEVAKVTGGAGGRVGRPGPNGIKTGGDGVNNGIKNGVDNVANSIRNGVDNTATPLQNN